MIKTLVIEDEADISNVIKLFLSSKGHEVTVCESAEDAEKSLIDNTFELVLVDRMLPGKTGVEFCQNFRAEDKNKNIPVVFITALSRPSNIVEGLDAGADDYITKPFDLEVLYARIHSVLRRYQLLNQQSSEFIEFENVTVNLDSRVVKVAGVETKLTNSEFKILVFLLKNINKVVSRKELVSFIQGDKVHVTERTIDTHMAALRKKLGSASSSIETIRGVGYRIDSKQ